MDRIAAHGARIVLLTNATRAADNDVGIPADDDVTRRVEHLNELYRQIAAARPDSVVVVDLARLVCPGGPPCPAYVEGVRLRPRDGIHFEADGAAWVAPRLVEAIVAALRAPPDRSAIAR